jgi:hypothetical protein
METKPAAKRLSKKPLLSKKVKWVGTLTKIENKSSTTNTQTTKRGRATSEKFLMMYRLYNYLHTKDCKILKLSTNNE